MPDPAWDALDRIAGVLEEAQESREALLRDGRKIISLCGKAIISVHMGKIKDGRRMQSEAAKMLETYGRIPHAGLDRHMITPQQEFVELSCLLAVAEGKGIPTDTDLAAMPEAYVLGLLDCVGELKRMVLDCVRKGESDEASRVFGIMDDLYQRLYLFSMYDKVLGESRRKVDVGRSLVESARAAITEESRRADLVRELEKTRMRAMGFEPMNS